MSEDIDYYCGLYVDASESEEVFAKGLANFLRLVTDKWNDIKSSEVSINILQNDDFDINERTDAENGFLFYRYKLEIEPNEELGQQNAVKFVSKILEYLWSKGYPATAACGYEDNLPNKGKLIPENQIWN